MIDEEQVIGGDDEEQELYEHHRVVVEKGHHLLRIDKFLFNRIERVSRNRIQVACEAGSVLVNGKAVKSNYRVKPLDVVTIVMATPVRETELIPQNIPVNIVYEDDVMIIVNKEAGMVVHPAYGNYDGTLMNALMYHFQHLPKKKHADVRPGLVHRIDKNTSGLLVIAKDEQVMTYLAKAFFDRTIKRSYLALVWGDVKGEGGTVTGHIGRNLKDRKIMQVFPEGEHGKHAVTHYTVVERFKYVTLVQCRLETGRTHQIRVHMKHIGHPIFSDDTYGGDKILKGTTFAKYKQFVENCFQIMPRQALHAKTLGILHPILKKEVFFESDLPEDFSTVLQKWRDYAAAIEK
jgi:23S rRNA pseudouridine1911/1915/1917 synthase